MTFYKLIIIYYKHNNLCFYERFFYIFIGLNYYFKRYNNKLGSEGIFIEKSNKVFTVNHLYFWVNIYILFGWIYHISTYMVWNFIWLEFLCYCFSLLRYNSRIRTLGKNRTPKRNERPYRNRFFLLFNLFLYERFTNIINGCF